MVKRKTKTHTARDIGPITDEWLKWSSMVSRYNALLTDLKRSTAPNGEKWREGMKRHYKKLISEIKASEPPKFG